MGDKLLKLALCFEKYAQEFLPKTGPSPAEPDIQYQALHKYQRINSALRHLQKKTIDLVAYCHSYEKNDQKLGQLAEAIGNTVNNWVNDVLFRGEQRSNREMLATQHSKYNERVAYYLRQLKMYMQPRLLSSGRINQLLNEVDQAYNMLIATITEVAKS